MPMSPNAAFRLHPSALPGAYGVTAASDHAFPRHHHDLFGIGVIEQGAQKSWSGRGTVEAGAGDVITVNPGEVHDGAPLAAGGRRWRILYLPPPVIADAVAGILPGRGGLFEFGQPVYRDPHLAVRLRQLLTEAIDARAAEEQVLTLLAPLLNPVAEPRVSGAAALRTLRDWIDAEPEADASLADLAERAGLSRYQVLRGFTRLTGMTPHAYRLQRRAQAARRLILGGQELADAAAACGFADQSHMTRLFRRVYGLAPGAFARLVAYSS